MRFYVMRVIFSDTRVDDDTRFTRMYAISAPTPADALRALSKDWMTNVETVDFVEVPSDRMEATPLDSIEARMTTGGWFDQLGKPVSPERATAALDLLTEHGYHRGNASMVLSVVCREIREDNPAAAQRYLRSFIGNDETLVLRTCATLCEAT